MTFDCARNSGVTVAPLRNDGMPLVETAAGAVAFDDEALNAVAVAAAFVVLARILDGIRPAGMPDGT